MRSPRDCSVPIQTRIPERAAKILKQIADRERRSVGAVVRNLIEDRIEAEADNNGKGKKP